MASTGTRVCLQRFHTHSLILNTCVAQPHDVAIFGPLKEKVRQLRVRAGQTCTVSRLNVCSIIWRAME